MASRQLSKASLKKQHRKAKKQALRASSDQLERLDSLPWNSAFSEKDDAFPLLVGSNELEGGFLSLEEIDETDYGLEITKPQTKSHEKKLKGGEKPKKRKSIEGDDGSVDSDEDGNEEIEEEEENQNEVKQPKKKSKKRKKEKKDSIKNNSVNNGADEIVEPADITHSKDDEIEDIKENDAEDLADQGEYYSWNELRLHPLLLKSVMRLKFKEPTPIQKACFPAAAHQGKDVFGAAETGSGKTLAFGLPILQRLLEERDKAEKLISETGEANERIVSRGYLRALIITPTRELAKQVTDHLKDVSRCTNIRVVSIFGEMSIEKQERLLKSRPEIVVGTPGRLWELMSGGAIHLVELHSLSFFVLDEADRMIQAGHFPELQSIIDMLPVANGSTKDQYQNIENCVTVTNIQRKKRQTLVFSATIALSADFRKKLKCGSLKLKSNNTLNSIEALSERAGMRANAAIIDLTNASILADKLEESFIESREEDKDAYLYYILSIHGQGRTIVFCTSITALRRISSLLHILGVDVATLHSKMQQRARLKAMDRFRAHEHGILVATDVAARGLDIPGVRTVIHYQLPHSADVYVHRSGRTARAFSDGCSIALISPKETSKFASLCKSFAKESFQRFPTELSYMPAVMKRLSLARQIDKILHKDTQEKAKKSWLEQNAESVELVLDENDSEGERVEKHKQKRAISVQLKKLQQELRTVLSQPLKPKTFSNRFVAGGGVSPLLQLQFEELAKQKYSDASSSRDNKRRKLVVIGQDCMEPLQALRRAGQEAHVDLKGIADKRRTKEDWRRKRKEEKKRLHDQRRKLRKKLQRGG